MPSALRLTESASESGKDEDTPEPHPTLEEFMPLKRRWEREQGSEEEREDRGVERPAWMDPDRDLWNQTRSRSAEGVRDEVIVQVIKLSLKQTGILWRFDICSCL